jgi:polyribonucleotide nucleotidyltransferase
MGSVCASTLGLLNAGVPLKAPVAGIAMGLISDTVDGKTEYVALTDILGAEDAFGDMDFKVAGTKDFVTALQLDTKLDGIPSEVLAAALSQARDARLHILDVMAEAIDRPDEMSPFAPRVTVVKIPVDKIGAVIGPKGQMINAIQDETGAQITIEDDGTIYVGASDGLSASAAVDRINAIANPQMPKVGERFLGTVVKTTPFGAFVSLLPGKDGLVHISKLGGGKRIGKVEDVVNVGDKLQVEITDIDARGKISLVPVQAESADAAPEGEAAPAGDQATARTGAPRCTAPPSRPARAAAMPWLPPATRRLSRVEKLEPAWASTAADSSVTGWAADTWSRAAIASLAPGSRGSPSSTSATDRPRSSGPGRAASSSPRWATSAWTVARSLPRPPRGSRSP